MPEKNCFLNPDAAWPKYGLGLLEQVAARLPLLTTQITQICAHATTAERSELVRKVLGPEADVGNLPPGIFAFATTLLLKANPSAGAASLRLVDDTGDGIITCTLTGRNGQRELTARARIVVCPPVFAPDRRHPVSIADGLKDRQGRGEVRNPAFFEKHNQKDSEVAEIVYDLFDRAFETAGLSNLDVWNEYFREENKARAQTPGGPVSPRQAANRVFNLDRLPTGSNLPLVESARRKHRRLSAREVLDDVFTEQKDLVHRVVRAPDTRQPLYDQRMPGLMRGSDRQPLHLTRRQYEILIGWARRLK